MNGDSVLRAFSILLLFIFGNIRQSNAQPMLPALDAMRDGYQVKLRWICQYDGVKSIAVKRSVDSSTNFATIGYVKFVGKGEQFYIDRAPVIGVGYYKLSIVFNSGLSWSSNVYKVVADTLQLLPQAINTISKSNANSTDTPEITTGTQLPLRQPHYSFKLSYPDIDMNDASFILPKYVTTHRVFSHAVVKLPNSDFKSHTYSIQFYGAMGRCIVDIPRLQLPEIIIDKRNFGRRATYVYKLRRDGVLLESGYINVAL